MRTDRGKVETLAVSGALWQEHAVDIRSMFFDSLESAKRSITISAFSMGNKTTDLERFFSIIEKKLIAKKHVTMIVNNDEKTLMKFSRKKLDSFSETFPKYFTLRKFKPQKTRKILHSKITVIDRRFALIGSANISRNALEHNYEMMLRVSGSVVDIMDDMMLKLSDAIQGGDQY